MKTLQEEIWEESDDPWGILVGCILIQRVAYSPARRAWDKLKLWYPSQQKMKNANPVLAEGACKHLGLQTVRARYLIEMSKQFPDWYSQEGQRLEADASKLPGCGGFAADAWDILFLGKLSKEIEDHVLEKRRRELVHEKASS